VQRLGALEIPETLEEACRPGRSAVLVYDMQEAIVPHIRDRDAVVGRVRAVIEAARAAGVPVAYSRHVSLPVEATGVAALRTAMAWQRVKRVEDVRAPLLPDSYEAAIIADLAPSPGDVVFDKLGMSAFVGSPLEVVLRDRGVGTLVVVGAVLEIGIEPTVRHGADLGFLPVVVEDACGVVEPDAAARSLRSLDYMMMSLRGTAEAVVAAFLGSSEP
jgi:biuret amidohydrolase